MFVLTGWNRAEGELEQSFSFKEEELALCIARAWAKAGWLPCLKCWTGGSIYLVSLNPSIRKAA